MGSHNSFTSYRYGFFCFFFPFSLLLFFYNLLIRGDDTNPQISSIVFSSKHVSLWQRKEIANCLNSCSVNYLITLLNIVYDHGQFNNSLPSQIPTKKFLERHILGEVDVHFNIIAHGQKSRIQRSRNSSGFLLFPKQTWRFMAIRFVQECMGQKLYSRAEKSFACSQSVTDVIFVPWD